MHSERRVFRIRLAAGLALGLVSGQALPLSFSMPLGDNSVEGVLNTTITFGAQWRMFDPSADLIGKADLNPNLCGRAENGAPLYQSCQGLFRTQIHPSQRLASGAGQFTLNADDGNLNYAKGDMTQAPLKVTQDLNLTYGDYGFFGKVLFFHDFVNNDFTENHPNWITAENYQQVGNPSPAPLLGLPFAVEIPRTDSVPCPSNRDSDGNPLTPCNLVYGAGGQVYKQRTDGEVLRQIGADLQMLDAYFYGKFAMPFTDGGKEITFKIGRQAVNWGESTLLAFGSINQANPINANNFYRLGFAVEEVFTPLGMVFLSTEPFENATLEGFYQYEWKPLEAPAYGSYLSFLDVGGTNNSGPSVFNIGFGGAADDVDINPDGGGYGRLLDNPLSGLTNTTSQGRRLLDNEPQDGGQFGIALKYYAEWLNNGTELGAYFMNYHARIPIASSYAVPYSCAKDTTTTVEFLANCSDIPLVHGLLDQGNPAAATDSAVNFDDLRLQLEYPENIQMFGVSFNTTIGDLSLQGEIAYRPNEPLQVDIEDLVFAAFGPTLSNCHIAPGCAGTGSGLGNVLGLLPPELAAVLNGVAQATGAQVVGGIGVDANGGTIVYPSSDFRDANGNPGAFTDTYDLLVGHMAGSGRSFPSFIIPYRGTTVGTNPGCQTGGHYTSATVLNSSSPCYIRGWEELQTFQFNLGGTWVLGATDNFIGADQVITLFEFGATWVPDLPPLNVLQFEAPGTYTHASAGADGSGGFWTDEASMRMACSTNQACSYGADGLRFNPHQQDGRYFPDKFSWGYDIIWQIRYESVLPGISIQPQILWKHDVGGTAPGLATNFVESRKNADVAIEMRYKSSFAFNLGYTWFWGGGPANLNRDRDAARAWVKLQF